MVVSLKSYKRFRRIDALHKFCTCFLFVFVFLFFSFCVTSTCIDALHKFCTCFLFVFVFLFFPFCVTSTCIYMKGLHSLYNCVIFYYCIVVPYRATFESSYY